MIRSYLYFICFILICAGLFFFLINLPSEKINPNNPKKPPKALIIPHHLIALDSIEVALASLQSEIASPSAIILITPNHYETGSSTITTTPNAFQFLTNLHLLDPSINQEILRNEHAVNDTVPLLDQHFPHTPVIPLVLSTRLSQDQITQLLPILQSALSHRAIIIGSIDFSHYLSLSEADKHDEITYQLILKRDYDQIRVLGNDHLDAPQVLELVLKTMDQVGAMGVEKLSHTNSGRIANNPLAPTTSHFIFLFR